MGTKLTIDLDLAELDALQDMRADLERTGERWGGPGDFARDILVSLIVTHLRLVAAGEPRH